MQRYQSLYEMAQEIHLARQAMGGPDQEEEPLLFPSFGYYLDEADPDIVVLRCQDGSYVAAFSAIGATRKGIVEAAREDYGRLIEANADLWGLRGDGDRKKSA